MDFDFERIPVPFRMQPGLRRLEPHERQLTPLAQGSLLWREKLAVHTAGHSRLAAEGFDPAPAIAAIHARALAEGLPAPAGPVELAFEEDFAVLDGETGRLLWLCVCVPSHWSPEDKIGLDFAAVHAPVADSAVLVAASRQLARLVTSGDCWERHVWTVSPSARHDQHPGRHARTPWPATPDPAAFAGACYFRAERQTFFPVPASRLAVFTIRVMLKPLVQAVDSPRKAALLRDALGSMSEAVLAYKGVAGARDPLLAWLGDRAAQ